MRVRITVVIAGMILALSGVSFTQEIKMDHFSQQELLATRKDLEAEATRGNGSASKKLAEYPNHYTMIALREKSGGAEVHEKYADIFFILDGHAELITGGTVENPKTTTPGEMVGTEVLGGKRQELSKGDVVHMSAGLPHQMLVKDGETVMYFVIKVKEL